MHVCGMAEFNKPNCVISAWRCEHSIQVPS